MIQKVACYLLVIFDNVSCISYCYDNKIICVCLSVHLLAYSCHIKLFYSCSYLSMQTSTGQVFVSKQNNAVDIFYKM